MRPRLALGFTHMVKEAQASRGFQGSDTFGSSSRCTSGQSKACKALRCCWGFMILTSAILSGGGHQEVRLERTTFFFGAKTHRLGDMSFTKFLGKLK